MIIAEIILGFLVLSLLTGGSWKKLGHARLRGEYLLLVLLPAQVLWPRVARYAVLDCTVILAIWIAMMAGLVLLLALNLKQHYMLGLAALGIVANIAVIMANGAMPVSIRAASEMGAARADARRLLEDDCLHEELREETRLEPLSDVIVIPGPAWHRGVVSVGDLLLAAGLGGWLFAASRRE